MLALGYTDALSALVWLRCLWLGGQPGHRLARQARAGVLTFTLALTSHPALFACSHAHSLREGHKMVANHLHGSK